MERHQMQSETFAEMLTSDCEIDIVERPIKVEQDQLDCLPDGAFEDLKGTQAKIEADETLTSKIEIVEHPIKFESGDQLDCLSQSAGEPCTSDNHPVHEVKNSKLHCNECSKKYAYPEMLAWHSEMCHGSNAAVRVIHISNRQQHYQCVLCGTEFRTVDLVIQHLSSKHQLLNLPYKCTICNRQFSKRPGLLAHQSKCNAKATMENSRQTVKDVKEQQMEPIEGVSTLRNYPVQEGIKLKSLHCLECGLKYTNPEMFAWHTENCHGTDAIVKVVKITNTLHSFHCVFCESVFKFQMSILQHLKNKHQIKKLPFQCKYFCNRQFIKRYDLINHQFICKKNKLGLNSAHIENIEQRTEDIRQPAESCTTNENMEQPIEQEPGNFRRSYPIHVKCDECGIRYSSREMLTWHIRFCHGPDAVVTAIRNNKEKVLYMCKLCKSELQSMDSIIQHLQRLHNIVLPFRCSICNTSFRNNKVMQTHICNKKKPIKTNGPSSKFHKCEDCEYKTLFSHVEMLVWHTENCHGMNRTINIVRNDDLRGFQCVSCKMEYVTLYKAINHLRLKHDLKKLPYSCNICNYKQFIAWHKLKQHQMVCKGTAPITHVDGYVENFQQTFEKVLITEEFAIKREPGVQLDFLPQNSDVESLPLIAECRVLVPKLLECDMCRFYADDKTELASHVHSHLAPNTSAVDSSIISTNKKRIKWNLKCNRCDLTYTHSEMFVWHRKNCHGTDAVVKIIKLRHRRQIKYQCSFCDTAYTHMTSIIQHLHSEHRFSNLPFQCNVCKKPITLFPNLLKHQLTCKKIKNYSVSPVKLFNQKHHVKCKMCDQIFESESKLKDHISFHHARGKRYCCGHCNKSFNILPAFKSHCQSYHPGRYFFRCDVCLTEFTSYAAYQRHRKYRHAGRVFACRICAATFSYPNTLQAHIKNLHSQKILSCNTCSMKFKCELYLRVHIQNVHSGQILKCEHCRYSSQKKHDLMLHIQSCHLQTFTV